MKKYLVLLLGCVNLVTNAQTSSDQSEIIPGQYIVVLNESVAIPVVKSGLTSGRSANKPHQELRQRNISKIKELQARQHIDSSSILFYYADAIVGFSAKLTAAEVLGLQNDPAIKGVYPDRQLKLVQSSGTNVKHSTFSQTADCAIVTAGGHADGSAKFTWIWIVDTGIDTDHPDLNVQMHAPYAKSFLGGPTDDLNGHGTHVAGIAAAKDNGIGVVGVSAGAKVVPVKVINDTGITSFALLIAGINHIAQYSIPGDVVNLSLGGFEPTCAALDPVLPTAMINLANAGVWICCAAGNDNNNATAYLPGCVNSKRIFTVAALDCNTSCAAYTNLGSNIDWYAVGTNVFSTYKDGGYSTLSGTSMATPVVAGIIHSRGQAPVRGPNISCVDIFQATITKPIARRL